MKQVGFYRKWVLHKMLKLCRERSTLWGEDKEDNEEVGGHSSFASQKIWGERDGSHRDNCVPANFFFFFFFSGDHRSFPSVNFSYKTKCKLMRAFAGQLVRPTANANKPGPKEQYLPSPLSFLDQPQTIAIQHIIYHTLKPWSTMIWTWPRSSRSSSGSTPTAMGRSTWPSRAHPTVHVWDWY